MTTIYDIAKLVGCAPSTVSKYITKHGYVSQALGEKIAAAMRDLDYHYNGIARILSTNSSNRIGVMVPFLDHPYFQSLVNAITMAATTDQEVTILPTAYSPVKERCCLDELEHRLIDSLIITSHTLSYQEITPYGKKHPIVFCETIPDPTARSVHIDRQAVLTELFQTLRHRHLNRIGCLFIRPAKESVTTTETLAAYQQVFGHPLSPDLVRYHCRSFADSQRLTTELLATTPNLQVILTESDISAAGARQVAGPKVVVIGQGNQVLSQLLGFPSIDQHLDTIGQQAVSLTQPDQPASIEKIKFDIIWRK